ncbi:uncharacterized protein FIESC28_00078 [Fusarium coffeatum]|uniref:Uncharacterized protein n=1 Tax=Fusarium coffeatum TaxID=231269 RepID=A0A366SCU4_9HYPO|nr:uncharacterized protein FIESC28_00078 [Fusarium coffeatum]RBR27134.1 hypothetical protein FIESC28_00078 [Fusarium coffeatum]
MTASPREAVSQNKMNNETAPGLSIRDLLIRNPGFAIHPLEWTAHHLELVNCHFQDASVPPDAKTPVHQEDSIKKLKDLLDVYCWRSQLFIDLLTNERSPFEHMEYVVPISSPVSSATEETVVPTAPLVVAFLDYDTVIRAREQRFPSGDSWTLNEPSREWNKRKLRLCTPKIWNRDPYLLCVMLALAQYKWVLFESERYPVRLVVHTSDDKVNAHVFQADFPIGVVDQMMTPSTRTNDTWPTIYHTKIAYEPYGTFADRLTSHLLNVNIQTAAKRDEAGSKTVKSELSIRTAALV